jgi:hypothetical protein
MNWYLFSQNNSGGGFIVNDDVAEEVLIQAESPENANEKAEEIGIYFDGIEKDIDCECCGDRWSEATDYDKVNIDEYVKYWPMHYFRDNIYLYFSGGKVKKLAKTAISTLDFETA